MPNDNDSAKQKQRLRMQKWKSKNAEQQKAYMLGWRSKNKEHVAAYAKQHVPPPEVKAKALERGRKYYFTVVKNDPEKLSDAAERSKKWSAENPGKVAARIRKYQASHRGILAERAKAAYHAKSEDERKALRASRAEYFRKWTEENKDRISADRKTKYDPKAQSEQYKKQYAANRTDYINRANARKRNLVGRGSFDQSDIDPLMEKQNGKCAGCGASIMKKFEIDHVMPISLGGSNMPDNLQLLCMPCNRSKHALHPDDWAKRIGKLFV